MFEFLKSNNNSESKSKDNNIYNNDNNILYIDSREGK